MRRRCGLATLLLLTAVLSGCSSGSDGVMDDPMIVLVGTSQDADFSSIQDAVDDSPSGSQIRIEPGTYTERVLVTKSLELVGEGPGVVIEMPGASAERAVIEILDATDVRVENLTVLGPDAGIDGILVEDARDVVILSVVASGNGDEGIDVSGSTDVEVWGIFEDNAEDGVLVHDGSQRVTVRSSLSSGNGRDGIRVRQSTDCVLQDNTSTQNAERGIDVAASAGCIVEGNAVTLNTEDGLRIRESTFDCTVRNNDVSQNFDDGIQIENSTLVQVTGNTVFSNADIGILVDQAPDTCLDQNSVSGNGTMDVFCDPGCVTACGS